MILDKRILKGKKPLTCLDAEEAMQFTGKECYFSDFAQQYEDLDSIENSDCVSTYKKGILTRVNCSGREEAFESAGQTVYKYCLPVEWVKKEQSLNHIDFEEAKKDKNFELCELYGEELLFDTKNDIFYTSDGNVHGYLTAMAQHRAQEEKEEQLKEVIEKKYRPYKDVEEFFDDVGCTLGDVIRFRKKGSFEEEYHTLLTGFKGIARVNIGLGDGGYYSLSDLFSLFELYTSDGWRPFGIAE